jgi:hypothetical protein
MFGNTFKEPVTGHNLEPDESIQSLTPCFHIIFNTNIPYARRQPLVLWPSGFTAQILYENFKCTLRLIRPQEGICYVELAITCLTELAKVIIHRPI